mmetsp:Transcript_14742/g.35156  ORF Transcript_14742/g.35156 Transcript_14742/m.35156 type:complete len:216 (-) Transcript_14742:295-942(-)
MPMHVCQIEALTGRSSEGPSSLSSSKGGIHQMQYEPAGILHCGLIMDGAYVIHCHRDNHTTPLTHECLMNYIDAMKVEFGEQVGKRIVIHKKHSLFVNAKPVALRTRREEMTTLHGKIERSGILVQEVGIKWENGSRRVQQGADVAIGTRLLETGAKKKVDAIILFAGDGVFLPALKRVKQTTRKYVFVCGFGKSVSPNLRPNGRGLVDKICIIG